MQAKLLHRIIQSGSKTESLSWQMYLYMKTEIVNRTPSKYSVAYPFSIEYFQNKIESHLAYLEKDYKKQRKQLKKILSRIIMEKGGSDGR